MDMNYRGGIWEGGGGQNGVEWGVKWDNCNSIINKLKKKKGHLDLTFTHLTLRLGTTQQSHINQKLTHGLITLQKDWVKKRNTGICLPIYEQLSKRDTSSTKSQLSSHGWCPLSNNAQ